MVGKIKDLIVKYRELIVYVIVGFATTGVNWVAYSVMVKFMHVNENYANAIAWVVAVAFAYVTNKIFVFRDKTGTAQSEVGKIVKFVGSRALTGVLEIFGFPLLVKAGIDQSLFGVKNFAAKIAISIVVMILNYVFSKLLVFRRKKEGQD